MKKNLKVLFTAILTVSLIGCGSASGNSGADSSQSKPESAGQSEKKDDSSKSEDAAGKPAVSEEIPETADLTGLWVQENKDENNYMAAVIRDDGKIGVFFILEGDETPWTYWVGTYEVPADGKKEFSWISENTYDGNGLMASGDETKEFTYKDDKISYPITIQGESGTITLVRGEWDASGIPESVFTAEKAAKADFQNIEISDSGWFVKNNEWLYYYVVLHNPNDKIAVELPGFRVTARDADGMLLGTGDQYLSVIYPGQDFVYGSQAFSVDEMPDTVEFEMLETEDYNLKNISMMDEYKPLEVVNAGIKSEKLLGEINNPNDYDLDSAIIVAICRNSEGEVINIETTFADDIKAGKLTPFSTSIYLDENPDSVEFFANQW